MHVRMLQRGDLVPHFCVTNMEGEAAAYSTIWQRRMLVLITVSATDRDGAFRRYVPELTAQTQTLAAADAALVVTRDAVDGVPCPGVVIADRWGEIVYVAGGPQAAALPSVGEVMQWIDFVQRQCPECEGETK